MKTVRDALPLWGLQGAKTRLIAARENAVYRVDHANRSLALRLHRRDYRTDAQLAEELDWMAWVAQSGLSVPAPFRSLNGPHLQIVDDVRVDVLAWLSGDTLDSLLPDMPSPMRTRTFYALGQTMAKLHTASDAWPQAATCDRPAWNIEGLLGAAPLWGPFWENPALTAEEKRLFQNFCTVASSDLGTLASSLDYGLIHADLVPANIMLDADTLHLIDFDDGGFGFRVFEVATALLKHRADPDFANLQTALIDGYTSLRALDMTALQLFLALRAVTYVGWNITRSHEDKTGARNARFIATACELTDTYLHTKQSSKTQNVPS